MVTQSGTDAAQQGLTSVIGREPVFFFFFSKKAQRAFYLQICYSYIKLINPFFLLVIYTNFIKTSYNVNINVSFSTLAKASPKHQ